jgi:hypothetical protein
MQGRVKARHFQARSAEAIQKRHLLRWIASGQRASVVLAMTDVSVS